MEKLSIDYVNPANLIPHPSNARQHSKKQISQIANSLKRFGFRLPILVTDGGTIVAGHGRVEAARKLGIDRIPVVCCDSLSEAEVRAYMILDNKLAENADWDRDALGAEFRSLSVLDLDFDLSITGFEMPEIDFLINTNRDPQDDRADLIPEPDERLIVTSAGDIWEVGPHRIMCGDARDPVCYSALLRDEHASVVFTDPPYNVRIDGNVCGLGKVRHREFAMASGEMSENEFISFLDDVFDNLVSFSADGSIHFICMDWRHMFELLAAGRRQYAEIKNLCVWNKTNGGMGSLYRSKHELVTVFKNGTCPHVNNVQLGKHGRNRTNVWDYAGISSPTATRNSELAMHPTVKPVAMIADALLDCSHRGDVVLDCFGGSGSTVIAAAQTGRVARVMEIDPAYVDVMVRRYQSYSGERARLVTGGATFDDFDIVFNGEQGVANVA